MLEECGLAVEHTTMYRWVQCYATELERRAKPYLRPTNASWGVDKTYIKVKDVWTYLYHALDSAGNTVDFMLSPTRDGSTATRFFRKVLEVPHTQERRVVNVDQHAAYPAAITVLNEDGDLYEACTLRRVNYLNSIIEQDHHFIKQLVRTRPRIWLIHDGNGDARWLRNERCTCSVKVNYAGLGKVTA